MLADTVLIRPKVIEFLPQIQRNSVLATNYDILIPISLKSDRVVLSFSNYEFYKMKKSMFENSKVHIKGLQHQVSKI